MGHSEIVWSLLVMVLLSAYSCSSSESCLPSDEAIVERMRSYCDHCFGTCDEATGHYVYLSLNYCSKNSTIPDEIGMLTDLKSLVISEFSVGLPSAIGNLSKLQDLSIGGGVPQVNIPYFIRHLVNLTTLYIDNNHFIGTLPSFLFELPRLTELHLNSNLLEGSLPKTLPSDSSLNNIDVSDNDLSGPVPLWVFSLRYAKLARNRLTSPINPMPALNGSHLNYLDLSDNRIEEIPDSVFVSSNVSDLNLGGNLLSGTFDVAKIKHMTGLEYLNLSWNQGLSLSEDEDTVLPSLRTFRIDHCDLRYFPNFLSLSENLEKLSLSNNKMRGSIDFSKGWNSLTHLDAAVNLLEGSLTAPPPNLTSLSLSENRLNGQIPATFCSSKISYLNLSFNGFDGVLDWKWEDCSHSFMYYLNLGNNNLAGSVPAGLPYLGALLLNGNRLTALPRMLLNSSYISALDIGNNNITDEFPHWLEDLQYLNVLIISNNNFYGDIAGTKPNSLLPFQNLAILDVSYNQLSGLLPVEYIQNFKYATEWFDDVYGYQVFIRYKGSRVSLKDAVVVEGKFFTSLDFSGNRFSGNISQGIVRLKKVVNLNLNNNNLSGEIPSLFRNLIKMRSLDLSSNSLVGGIPKELMKLKRLDYLNLSNNHLEGPIPSGKSFPNNSYAGNIGLCGIPLVNACLKVVK